VTLAFAVVALVALGSQGANPELADGFYCSTDHYFAYETLLHDSAEAHLLHVVPLVEASRQAPEITVAIPAAHTRGIRCTASAVALRDDSQITKVAIDTRRWSASRAAQAPDDGTDAWVTTRLWGNGAWSRSAATERRRLRTVSDGSSTSLETYRVSTGSCASRVGSRLAWHDPKGRETRSQALFYRWPSCKASDSEPAPVDPCAATNSRISHRFNGKLTAGESYRRTLGPFVFRLVDEGRFGWSIVVNPQGESRDLTSLLPLHGPSGRDIQPFRPFDNPTPVTYPFAFHPEARRGISYSQDTYTNLINDLRIDSYGRGRVTVRRQEIAPGADGRPQFRWIEFDACLSWPR
jgi:hypothetical protein